MPARLPTLPSVLARICALTKLQLVEERLRVLVQNGVQASATAALLELLCWVVKLRTLAMHLLQVPQGVSMQ
jgi:hypothetical protein